jgi:hypothetical protein
VLRKIDAGVLALLVMVLVEHLLLRSAVKKYYAIHLPHYDSIGSYTFAYEVLNAYAADGWWAGVKLASGFGLSLTQPMFAAFFLFFRHLVLRNTASGVLLGIAIALTILSRLRAGLRLDNHGAAVPRVVVSLVRSGRLPKNIVALAVPCMIATAGESSRAQWTAPHELDEGAIDVAQHGVVPLQIRLLEGGAVMLEVRRLGIALREAKPVLAAPA